MRNNQTETEKKLWLFLKIKPAGVKFRRQHPVSNYIVDFYCHSLKLVIEVDGGIHKDAIVNEQDKHRQEFLESAGLVFLRFSNDEIENDFNSVCKKIEDFITNHVT